eukprot:CAMPEP_0169335376 /NCGR_PEP_ID=MMETSP1017-20121227/16292_1 /TAXON_ID=342587 /ORGANISM="Karlodinium micrum, Strain CCMP2283" /LENGTH=246 /DNA_ID=CAMNT_0009430725 /DNA_START=455 /DNA_END=1195 /DNA_ORIENTATION=-
MNFPMKLYELLVLPFVLRYVGEKGLHPSERQGGFDILKILKLFQDPITLSLFAGLATALATNGRGLEALGFFGNAIDLLAAAQTPVLFLLLGLKMNLNSSAPLFCFVLLLANQGVLMMLASIFVHVADLGDDMAQFVTLFSQGSPAVLGVAVIKSAVDSGVEAYSVDFAFDIVGLALPVTSLFQCIAGLAGQSYPRMAGGVGFALVFIAIALRVAFRNVFKVHDDQEGEPPAFEKTGAQIKHKDFV